MRQIMFAADTASLDTWNILESARSDEDNIVLLQIVTLAWHIRCQLLPTRDTNQNTLKNIHG